MKVASGRYNQTVAITKAIQLVGAGAATTTIDGRGLDTTGSVYGVVYVGSTAGAASVSGFIITNPFPPTPTQEVSPKQWRPALFKQNTVAALIANTAAPNTYPAEGR